MDGHAAAIAVAVVGFVVAVVVAAPSAPNTPAAGSHDAGAAAKKAAVDPGGGS